MMAKKPDDRYQTAGEMMKALAEWLKTQGVAVETIEAQRPAAVGKSSAMRTVRSGRRPTTITAEGDDFAH